ncbi:hypothetical protein L1987_40161 [Smallanthus sonchifolius]|uniref:Uncharacterized protein n=1 Tax=Smallanthus sonchifolius TaxID=185202 RepID=A0ACB9GSJ0_9ASTR|nr:hypothetical protein L1987_40161 [Smallanthus sonchifolius]
MYRYSFQVEDEEWCPGWIVKPKKHSTSDHSQVESDGEDQGPLVQLVDERSAQLGDDRSSTHGEKEQSSMGKEVEAINDKINNNNKSLFHFETGDAVNIVVQDKNSSPNINDVAQRINFQFGSVSRKRPRTDKFVGDPFDLDRFINRNGPLSGTNSTAENLDNSIHLLRLSPFPDLNSSMGGSSSEASGDWVRSGFIPDTNDPSTRIKKSTDELHTPNEVESTISMGKKLGVNLDNLEEMVREVIDGEMVTVVVP